MKVGDVVMFTDASCTYTKWFFGHIGIVESTSSGAIHCRVRWMRPVRYHDGYATISDFRADKFQVTIS